MKNPTAFTSYSWDDDAHRDWVAQLATRLRSDGVDVTLDQWHAVPGDQLPAFMEREIRANDYVLIVCTQKYKLKSDGRLGGVGYEGDIMTAEVFTKANHRKFVPILARGTWTEAAPSWLAGKYYVDLSNPLGFEAQYEDLVATISGRRQAPPPLGAISRSATYRVYYAAPRDITSPGLDGKKFSFPLTFVPEEYVGAPDEKMHVKRLEVVVSMSGTIIAIWSLTDRDWIRVLFEFARRFFKDELAKNPDLSPGRIEHPMIVSRLYQHGCPFDPRRIPDPEKFSEDVQIEKRMGSGPS